MDKKENWLNSKLPTPILTNNASKLESISQMLEAKIFRKGFKTVEKLATIGLECVLDEDTRDLYICSGLYITTSYSKSFFKYNLDTEKWKELEEREHGVGMPKSFITKYHGRKSVFLFGGKSEGNRNSICKTFSIYDIEKNQWTQLSVDPDFKSKYNYYSYGGLNMLKLRNKSSENEEEKEEFINYLVMFTKTKTREEDKYDTIILFDYNSNKMIFKDINGGIKEKLQCGCFHKHSFYFLGKTESNDYMVLKENQNCILFKMDMEDLENGYQPVKYQMPEHELDNFRNGIMFVHKNKYLVIWGGLMGEERLIIKNCRQKVNVLNLKTRIWKKYESFHKNKDYSISRIAFCYYFEKNSLFVFGGFNSFEVEKNDGEGENIDWVAFDDIFEIELSPIEESSDLRKMDISSRVEFLRLNRDQKTIKMVKFRIGFDITFLCCTNLLYL